MSASPRRATARFPPASSNIYITDNHIHGVYTGINVSGANGLWISGNDIERYWEDAHHITRSDNLTIQWEYAHNERAGPAHGDPLQLNLVNMPTGSYGYVRALDNVVYIGRGGGIGDGTGEADGNNFIFSNAPSGISFSEVTYSGNIVMDENGNGARPSNLSTATFSFNAWIRDQAGQATAGAGNPALVFDGPDGSNSNVKMQCNVTMLPGYYTLGAATDPNPTMTVNSVQSNIYLQSSGYSSAFTGVLPTSKPSVGMTLAQLMAVLAPKSGGVLNTLNTTSGCYPGPFKYVDYVNRIDSRPTVSP